MIEQQMELADIQQGDLIIVKQRVYFVVENVVAVKPDYDVVVSGHDEHGKRQEIVGRPQDKVRVRRV